MQGTRAGINASWLTYTAATLLLLAGQSLAAPSSLVAWTPEARRFVDAGDAGKGKGLAQQCASCHGPQGISTNPAWPNLAGQLAAYTFKQLRDYKDGKRQHPIMAPIAAALDEQGMADVAAFYAQMPVPAVDLPASGPAAELVYFGDGKRLIPGCATCHGTAGHGSSIDVPALAGQQAEYLRQTMLAFKTGSRANDIYQRMRLMAHALTEQEMSLLADYYAAGQAR